MTHQASRLNNLGCMWIKEGNFGKAIVYLDKAMQSCVSLTGSVSSSTTSDSGSSGTTRGRSAEARRDMVSSSSSSNTSTTQCMNNINSSSISNILSPSRMDGCYRHHQEQLFDMVTHAPASVLRNHELCGSLLYKHPISIPICGGGGRSLGGSIHSYARSLMRVVVFNMALANHLYAKGKQKSEDADQEEVAALLARAESLYSIVSTSFDDRRRMQQRRRRLPFTSQLLRLASENNLGHIHASKGEDTKSFHYFQHIVDTVSMMTAEQADGAEHDDDYLSEEVAPLSSSLPSSYVYSNQQPHMLSYLFFFLQNAMCLVARESSSASIAAAA